MIQNNKSHVSWSNLIISRAIWHVAWCSQTTCRPHPAIEKKNTEFCLPSNTFDASSKHEDINISWQYLFKILSNIVMKDFDEKPIEIQPECLTLVKHFSKMLTFFLRWYKLRWIQIFKFYDTILWKKKR